MMNAELTGPLDKLRRVLPTGMTNVDLNSKKTTLTRTIYSLTENPMRKKPEKSMGDVLK